MAFRLSSSGRTYALLSAPLVLLGALACSSSSSSPGDEATCGGGAPYDSGLPDPPQLASVDEPAFANLYVKTYCDAVEACCQSQQVPFGRSGCEQSASQAAAGLKGSVSSHYNPKTAAACIADLQWFGTVCPVTGTIAVLGPGIECGGVYEGDIPAGYPCTSRTQCAVPADGAAMCLPVSAPGSNVCCTFVEDRGPGETCSRLSDNGSVFHDCIAGYECDETTGVCTAECEGGLGANCASQGCATGLHCDATDHCAPLGAPGAACTDGLDCYGTCDNNVCSLGLDAEVCYSP